MATAIYYASRDPATGIKTYDLHTFSQIRKVLEDGAAVKLQKLQKFAQLRNQIYSALTLADIHSIDWVQTFPIKPLNKGTLSLNFPKIFLSFM